MSQFKKSNKDNLDAEVMNVNEDTDNISSDTKEEDKVHIEEVIEASQEFIDEFETDQDDMIVKPDTESIKEKIHKSFHSRKFIGGAYATVISAVVIVVVILVNVLASELDLKIDVSKEGMYTITDVTKDYVKDMKDDITLYYMAQTGNEDSIIVVNNTNGRAKYIDNSDMLVTEVDYSTYSTSVTGLDIEGQITSALQYVTTEDLPVMYMVKGHGETEIGTTLAGSLAKVNVTTNTLATLTTDTIPEDCSILLINGPTTDYSEDEVAMVKDYLTKGGSAIILADYRAKDLVNFNGLLNYYGVELVDGIVIEGDKSYYTGQYPNTLVPDLAYQDITQSLRTDNIAVVVPTATGIKAMDSVRSTVTVTPLLTTSDSAYSKVDINSTTAEKESSDIDGPFDLGVAITENYNDVETKLVVYGSVYLTDESFVSYPSIGNMDLFINSVNYTAGKQETLAVRTRSIEQAYLTLNAAQVNFLAPVIVVVIPVIILGIGGFICIRRRRK